MNKQPVVYSAFGNFAVLSTSPADVANGHYNDLVWPRFVRTATD